MGPRPAPLGRRSRGDFGAEEEAQRGGEVGVCRKAVAAAGFYNPQGGRGAGDGTASRTALWGPRRATLSWGRGHRSSHCRCCCCYCCCRLRHPAPWLSTPSWSPETFPPTRLGRSNSCRASTRKPSRCCTRAQSPAGRTTPTSPRKLSCLLGCRLHIFLWRSTCLGLGGGGGGYS